MAGRAVDHWDRSVEQLHVELAWFERRVASGEEGRGWAPDRPWPKAAIPALTDAPEHVQDAVLRFGAALILMKLALQAESYLDDLSLTIHELDEDLALRMRELVPALDLADSRGRCGQMKGRTA